MVQHQDLQRLGLNEKEAKVYLTCLELGPSTIAKIAALSGIKRTTVYEVIKTLKEKQLVSETAKGIKKLFVAVEPEQLKLLVDRQQKILSTILPELKGLSKTAKTRPTIRVFEGHDLRKIYEDTLLEKKTIYAFVSVSAVAPELYEYLSRTYVRQRVKYKIKALVITPRTESAVSYKDRGKEEVRETRLVNPEKYPFSIEINIYGNKVAFISYKQNELFGAIIESTEIAKTMKTIFNFFWDHA